MIYLAAPYGHPDKKVVSYRMDMVEKTIAVLFSQGFHITSPLLMHYVVDKGIKLPTNFEFWGNFCLDFLGRCSSMKILTLEGWDVSRGVLEEIEFCNKNLIPVSYISELEVLTMLASKR